MLDSHYVFEINLTIDAINYCSIFSDLFCLFQFYAVMKLHLESAIPVDI